MHTEIEKLYREAGYNPPPDPDDNVEKEFFRGTLQSSRKSRVDQVWRLKQGDEEYITYNETVIGYTQEGNPRYWPRYRVGMYERPFFEQVLNPQTNMVEPVARINRRQDVFEIPYSAANVKKILEKDQFKTKTGMMIDTGFGRYTVMNKEDFINLPFDKLYEKVTGAQAGTLTASPAPIIQSDVGIQQTRNTLSDQLSQREQTYAFDRQFHASFGPTLAEPVPTQTQNIHASFGPTPSTVGEQVNMQREAEEERERQKKRGKEGEEPEKKTAAILENQRVAEHVNVVLRNQDTGEKRTITEQSTTIESPQKAGGLQASDQEEDETKGSRRQEKERTQTRRTGKEE